MSDSNVLTFMENGSKRMSIEEGFAFIERSRRQLDRFTVAIAPENMRIVPAFEAEVRADLDDLEARLLAQTQRD